MGENDLSGEATCKHLDCRVVGNLHRDESSLHHRDPEAILLIKQLQEKVHLLFSLPTTGTSSKVAFLSSVSAICLPLIRFVQKINMLETEKSSSKQNLDDLVTIATEQNICGKRKIAEVSVVL